MSLSNEKLNELINKLKQRKKLLHEEYKVRELGIFGSYVRGEEHQKSDLDVLVDFEAPIGLLRFVHLENELSDFLGIKVDLVMRDSLKPKIGERILNEVIYL